MTLKEYIRREVARVGMDAFKHRFGVQESTVNQWRRSWSLPRPHQMALIVKLSRGRVSYVTMVEAHLQAQKKRYSK